MPKRNISLVGLSWPPLTLPCDTCDTSVALRPPTTTKWSPAGGDITVGVWCDLATVFSTIQYCTILNFQKNPSEY